MIQFSSDFAYKNENGYLAILLNVHNIIHCYVSLFFFLLIFCYMSINRNFGNKNIYMFLSVSIHEIYILFYLYKRKSYDPMTSLSKLFPSPVAPAFITLCW